MKITLKCILLLVMLVTSAAAADVTYSILSITEPRGDEWIMVDKVWRKDSPRRLEVKVRASEDTPSSQLVGKAYFYDADKKLIHTYAAPCPRWMRTKRGYESVGLPDVLEKNKVIELWFPLTPELLKLNPKTALVVFGDKKRVVVRSRNSTPAMEFEFPEKSKVVDVSK